jgi:predicted permease
MAMGGSRAALVRQLLVESCLLAGAGTVLAIPLAKGLGRVLLASLATSQSMPVITMPTDWRVVVFATLLACGTCFLMGLVPAVRVSRMEPVALKTGDRGTTTPRERLSFQRLIVVTQIAMSLVMLVAALLFVQSFRGLIAVDTGMRRHGVSLGAFRFPDSVPQERFDDFRRELLAHIRSVPEIASVGTTTRTPMGGASWGHDVRVGAEQASARFTWVSQGYFETMGIPILKGRDLSLRDTRESARVAVVNEAFVRRFLGAAAPIGKTLQTSPEPQYPSTVYEIVGVIPDTAYNDVRGELQPMVFAPDTQHPSPGPNVQVVLYSPVSADLVLARVRNHVSQRYPDLMAEYVNLDSRVQDILVRERLLAVVAGLFGVLAVVLTVVGVYGLLSYAVAQRQQEMGLRLALGARGSQILGRVMIEGGRLLLLGATVGSLASLAVGGAASSLLFGVAPNDPTILAAAFLLLGVITAIACYVPARRAARIDPIAALRCE